MFEYESEKDQSFFRRHRDLVFIAVVVALGVTVLIAGKFLSRNSQRPVAREEFTMIVLPPTPPPFPTPQPTPPPPAPTPEQQEEHRMEEQPPVQDEKKPDPPKEKTPDAPAPLGTSITGPGGGQDLGLGLGRGGGYGSGDGGAGGSKYGWYASEIQNRIAQVVRDDARVRRVTMHVVVRIWPDATGRIARAIVSSSGDSALDALVQNQILTGIQLAEGPPADMPLPIVMRLSIEPSR